MSSILAPSSTIITASIGGIDAALFNLGYKQKAYESECIRLDMECITACSEIRQRCEAEIAKVTKLYRAKRKQLDENAGRQLLSVKQQAEDKLRSAISGLSPPKPVRRRQPLVRAGMRISMETA